MLSNIGRSLGVYLRSCQFRGDARVGCDILFSTDGSRWPERPDGFREGRMISHLYCERVVSEAKQLEWLKTYE